MSIKEQWEAMNGQNDENLSQLINKKTLQADSKDPLTMLRKNILANTVWAFVIAIGYLLVVIKFPYWPIIVCIGFTFLFTCIGIVTNMRLFRKINQPGANNNLLQEMERHYATVIAWIKNQEKAMLFVYPIAAVGGFMLGWSLSSGRPIEEMLEKTTTVILMAVIAAVIVPAGYLLAKRLNKKAFGQYCEQLRQNIEALKAGE